MTAALTLSPAAPVQSVPDIRTQRLVLRPLKPSDVGLIEHYTADRRLAERTRTIPHPLPPGAAEAWVNRALSGSDPELWIWVIDGSAVDLAEVLGVLSLSRVAPEQCELEFWIGAGFWNTGFATEAVKGLIEANPRQCRSMVAESFQDNAGSARVLTNCGFNYLGDAESWSVARNARVATWTYARPMT